MEYMEYIGTVELLRNPLQLPLCELASHAATSAGKVGMISPGMVSGGVRRAPMALQSAQNAPAHFLRFITAAVR
jgi:hypothetical protein